MAYGFGGASLELTSGARSEDDLRRALTTLRRLADGYRKKGRDVPRGIAEEIARYEAYFAQEASKAQKADAGS